MSVVVSFDDYGDTHGLALARGRYMDNNNTAIEAFWDGDGYLEPYAVVTVNLGESLDAHEAYISGDVGKDLVDALVAANVIRDTGQRGYSGWGEYMLVRISDEAYDAMDVLDDAMCEENVAAALREWREGTLDAGLPRFESSMPMPQPSPISSISDAFSSDGSDYDFDIPF